MRKRKTESATRIAVTAKATSLTGANYAEWIRSLKDRVRAARQRAALAVATYELEKLGLPSVAALQEGLTKALCAPKSISKKESKTKVKAR